MANKQSKDIDSLGSLAISAKFFHQEWICQSCGEKVIGKQKDLITQGYKHKCSDTTQGDDSIKEKILAIHFKHKALVTVDMETGETYVVPELLALFQSQNSKTLERVREKVEELKTSQTVGTKIDLLRKVDVLAILEAEKGQK